MNKKSKILLLLSLLILFAMPVYAAEESGIKLAILGFLRFIKYLIIFLLVILIAKYGTGFIAKNYNVMNPNNYIKKIDSISLASNISIYLIEIDSMIYVLASSGDSVELLDILEKTESELVKYGGSDLCKEDANRDMIKRIKEKISGEEKDEKMDI